MLIWRNSEQAEALSLRILSIDIDVQPHTDQILALAAVRTAGDASTEVVLRHNRRDLPATLTRLDSLAVDADFLLGHNLIRLDLHKLHVVSPRMELFDKPQVDSLMTG